MAKKAAVLKIPCAFGGVSSGKKSTRIGISVPRAELNLSTADKTFCDTRLRLTIKASGNGDQEGQGRLAGMEDDLSVSGTADVKGFAVHTETITFGLTFNRKELRGACEAEKIEAADFAAREGSLIVEDVGEIPEAEAAEEESGDKDAD